MRKGRWTQDEVLRLKRSFGVYPIEWIALVLRRPIEEVEARKQALAKRQRTGPWTRAELRMLKGLHGSRSDEHLALALQRNAVDIHHKARELCLCKDKAFARRRVARHGVTPMPRWQGADLELLRSLYPDHSNIEIARRLGRSVKSVLSKAGDLGLRKSSRHLQSMGRENVALRRRSTTGSVAGATR
jgi:hypothetical protein